VNFSAKRKISDPLRWFVGLAVAAWLISFWSPAGAVPMYARQTGFDCSQCHTNFPELTPFGRQFKIEGYTRSDPKVAPKIPIAAMTWFGANTVSNNQTAAGGPAFPKNGALVWEGGSLFTGGRVTDNFGGFIQYSYNNLAPNADGDINHTSGHSFVDNTDLRAVVRPTWGSMPVVLGMTLNNSLLVQDVWNSTPAWGYPFKTPPLGAGFGQLTFIESGYRLAGLGAYAWIDKKVYLEAGAYKTADGVFSILTEGTPSGLFQQGPFPGRQQARTRIKGGAPYWRANYNWDGAENHLMVGTFGTIAVADPTDPATNGGVGDKYKDYGLDAQFQHFSSEDERHILTSQFSYIYEKTDWRSSFPTFSDSPSTTLRSQHFKVTYLYDRKYGLTGALFGTAGSTNVLRYGTGGLDALGNPLPGSGKPDTTGYILEGQWTPPLKLDADPQLTVRFSLQYTGYWKYHGSSSDYDASLRNASNNNSLYIYAWIAM